MRRAALALGVLLLVLVGCAGQARFARPADFPLHSTEHPFFDLHWLLDREAGGVEAVGLVEATRVDGVAEVVLELRGVDGSDRVVSRARGRTYGGRLPRWSTLPFTVRLLPTGEEIRFELGVWSFDWQGTRPKAGQ